MANHLSEQILKVIESNSRLTNQKIAIMLGLSEEKVQIEIEKLESAHIIYGYHTLINSDIWLYLYPSNGAFYLFIRTLLPDPVAFCQYARNYELLIVPGDDFGCPGYARIAYCVPADRIERALPRFKKLAEDFRGEKGIVL